MIPLCRIGCLIALAVPLWGLPAGAAPTPGARFGDWGIACEPEPDGGRRCFAQQSQMLREVNKRVLNLVIGTLGPAGEPIMVATLPLGLNLQIGGAYRVDDQPAQPLVFHHCTPAGCVSLVRLTPATLDHLRHGRALAFSFQPFGTDKTVAVTVSLKGLDQALAALEL